jgi:hypothetical protein
VSPRKTRRLSADVPRRPRGGRAGTATGPGGRPGADHESEGQAGRGAALIGLGPQRVESWPDGDWVVRQVPGAAATKQYRCPGCDQEIRPGTAHVVVWSAEEPGPAERRHWHTACWQRRPRRRGAGPQTHR